jgi:hypothetical protein
MLHLIQPTKEEIVEVAAIFPPDDPRHEQLLRLSQAIKTEDGTNGNISI